MKKRILVVEDFNTSRLVIRKTLESLGYMVDEAADGREAIRYFDGRPIHLVITDFNMPFMDGATLACWIRNQEAYRYIPVLMLSTETSPEKLQRAREAKITGWIRKPFDVNEFRDVIRRVLN